MNNPFSRLKHYAFGDNDPQENHATECLAACLIFSPHIRGIFLRFLFGSAASADCDLEMFDVQTQFPISDGCIDLLLTDTDKSSIAVEIKVKAPENGPQLQRYRRWLDEQSNGLLFTLVKTKDAKFAPEQYGVVQNGRRTWRELLVCLNEAQKESPTIRNRIISLGKLVWLLGK